MKFNDEVHSLGKDWSSYTHVQIHYPSNDCQWWYEEHKGGVYWYTRRNDKGCAAGNADYFRWYRFLSDPSRNGVHYKNSVRSKLKGARFEDMTSVTAGVRSGGDSLPEVFAFGWLRTAKGQKMDWRPAYPELVKVQCFQDPFGHVPSAYMGARIPLEKTAMPSCGCRPTVVVTALLTCNAMWFQYCIGPI